MRSICLLIIKLFLLHVDDLWLWFIIHKITIFFFFWALRLLIFLTDLYMVYNSMFTIHKINKKHRHIIFVIFFFLILVLSLSQISSNSQQYVIGKSLIWIRVVLWQKASLSLEALCSVYGLGAHVLLHYSPFVTTIYI